VTGSALLIRARTLSQLEGWSEIYDFYLEDIDLCLSAWRLGWQVVQEPSAVVFHVLSATAGSGSEFHLLRQWRNKLLLVAIHWPAGLLLRLLPLFLVWEIKDFARKGRRPLRWRAWREALGKLPEALRRRRRLKGRASWVAMLRPARSVPAIRLPAATLAGTGEGP